MWNDAGELSAISKSKVGVLAHNDGLYGRIARWPSTPTLRFALLIALVVFSAAAGPETRPATAAIEPPASTPKEALRSVNLAQRDGDSAALRALFVAENEKESRLLGAMADYAGSLADLRAAARQAYGAAGAVIVIGDTKAESDKGLAAIEKAEVTIKGDTASVKYAGATDAPIRLVKVDGRWKLPISQLAEGQDANASEMVVKELAAQTRIARTMAQEINAGKYKEGANKAREVWRSRLLEAAKIAGGGKGQ
jgi:hypothetical protein